MADPKHHVPRVVTPAGVAPLFDLAGKIGRRLSRERRIGRTDALGGKAVAACAGREPALRVAPDVRNRSGRGGPGLRFKRHAAIELGDPLALLGGELLGDPAHLRMVAPAVGIGLELAMDITGVEAGKARTSSAIAASPQPVAGKARIRRPRAGTAQRDQLAAGAEPFARCGVHRTAGGEQRSRDGRAAKAGSKGAQHGTRGTAGLARRFRKCSGKAIDEGGPLPKASDLIPLLLLASACKPPPEERQMMPLASAERGKQAIERVGCASCHTIEGMSGRALIAGRLSNRPEVLARFVRNAPALVPDTVMPAMPLTEQESRDVAAYLYEISD